MRRVCVCNKFPYHCGLILGVVRTPKSTAGCASLGSSRFFMYVRMYVGGVSNSNHSRWTTGKCNVDCLMLPFFTRFFFGNNNIRYG